MLGRSWVLLPAGNHILFPFPHDRVMLIITTVTFVFKPKLYYLLLFIILDEVLTYFMFVYEHEQHLYLQRNKKVPDLFIQRSSAILKLSGNLILASLMVPVLGIYFSSRQ